MYSSISANTQAILLLTAPLLLGGSVPSVELLKPSEYKKLARYLREIKHEPADLLSNDREKLIQRCSHLVAPNRMQLLIGRGFLLSQVLEQWRSRSIWVLSRADSLYPKILKKALREDAPAVLYGCGDVSLLNTGGLAVVGPRKTDNSLERFAFEVGKLCAISNQTLISGGAKGIDLAAMTGAQENGGVVCNVMAEKLAKAAIDRSNRDNILNNKLVLVSAYDPNAAFNAGHAMQRNKLIYGLSQAALVVDAMVNKGGTWAGAAEQLEKLNLVPVYVRGSGSKSEGLEALKRKGAMVWPDPINEEEFSKVLTYSSVLMPQQVRVGITSSLFEASEDLSSSVAKPERFPVVGISSDEVKDANAPKDRLFVFVKKLLTEMLNSPMSEAEIASELNVSKLQARAWLSLLIQDESLVKLTNPVRYKVKNE
ncbi:MAG: DNA protecting protein DprA [Oceanospirillum sp.]|nr:DNA protecting protein DprA [Oceanospirillum sp.]